MCTYETVRVEIKGSGKGTPSWIPVTEVGVYYDHPAHMQAEHTLNIDFLNPDRGPSARVAVELTADAARDLAHAILAALESVPEGLLTSSSRV